MDFRIILHDIRSTHNVGSVFRTSDAAGVSHVYLSGYTPTPVDEYGRDRKDISKVALGAEKTVPWSYEKSVVRLIAKLKKEGFTVVALEQDPKSQDYKKIKLPKKFALILGNEVDGISPALLKKCDLIAEIPMKGQKESLNVSVAAGIAIFRLLNI